MVQFKFSKPAHCAKKWLTVLREVRVCPSERFLDPPPGPQKSFIRKLPGG